MDAYIYILILYPWFIIFGSNVLGNLWVKAIYSVFLNYFFFLLMYEIVFLARSNFQILVFGVSKA